MERPPYTVRKATKRDLGFVFGYWTDQFRQTYPVNLIPANIYYERQRLLINKILETANCEVAHLDDEPDILGGFIVWQILNNHLVIHWLGVKTPEIGIGTLLLNNIDANINSRSIICSHISKIFKQYQHKYHLIYDPSILDLL